MMFVFNLSARARADMTWTLYCLRPIHARKQNKAFARARAHRYKNANRKRAFYTILLRRRRSNRDLLALVP